MESVDIQPHHTERIVPIVVITRMFESGSEKDSLPKIESYAIESHMLPTSRTTR